MYIFDSFSKCKNFNIHSPNKLLSCKRPDLNLGPDSIFRNKIVLYSQTDSCIHIIVLEDIHDYIK